MLVKLKKLLVDSQQSYQRVAILTEKGKIYWCGRNEYGWAMMGNTSDVNTFTQMGNGPGSGTHSSATNMWFTGNGRYASFWTKDQEGKIKCAGYNGNYELGLGNTTNQSSAVSLNGKLMLEQLRLQRKMFITLKILDVNLHMVTNGIVQSTY